MYYNSPTSPKRFKHAKLAFCNSGGSNKKARLAKLFRKGWETYVNRPNAAGNLKFDDPRRKATQLKIMSSAQYLAEHLKEVSIHVIPCVTPRTDLGQTVAAQSAAWGSIGPAAWSFMLAARLFGLGTTWTSFIYYSKKKLQLFWIFHIKKLCKPH
jgi:nitroreductase